MAMGTLGIMANKHDNYRAHDSLRIRSKPIRISLFFRKW